MRPQKMLPRLTFGPLLPACTHRRPYPSLSAAVTQPMAMAMMAGEDDRRSLLEGESLMNLCLLAHKHSVNTDACETKAAVIQALLASLEAESLMTLCLRAHKHGLNIDGCETKADVIRALLAPGKKAGGLVSTPVPQAAPVWGMGLSPDAAQVEKVSQFLS